MKKSWIVFALFIGCILRELWKLQDMLNKTNETLCSINKNLLDVWSKSERCAWYLNNIDIQLMKKSDK